MMRLEVFRLATDMLQYLDPDGLDETVLNIGQIKTNLEGQISDLEESIEEEMQNLPYARPDGLYPEMTVGAVIGADETAQWATRESTGSGAATVRSVQGASVAWNQLCVNGNFEQKANWIEQNASYTVSDNVATMLATAQHGRIYTNITKPMKAGSKLLYMCELNPTSACVVRVGSWYSTAYNVLANIVPGWQRVAHIATFASDVASQPFGITDTRESGWDAIQIRNAMAIDLTAMFGAGNEPSTVDEFEAMYPLPYYPYSAPTLKPVTITGIASTDANGDALDGVEWESYTLRAAGSVADMLYSDHVDVRVGVVDLGTFNWTYADGKFYTRADYIKFQGGLTCIPYAEYVGTLANMPDKTITASNSQAFLLLRVRDDAYSDAATFKAAMNGVLLFYELATPTTQPITPALSMTYRVEQGGTEAIIVPDGEVSAAPVLTVAEPVNAGDEFARIWAAIQSLGYTRNAAQLSRPVSLTDIGSIDEVQDNTTEIDTTKEVTE